MRWSAARRYPNQGARWATTRLRAGPSRVEPLAHDAAVAWDDGRVMVATAHHDDAPLLGRVAEQRLLTSLLDDYTATRERRDHPAAAFVRQIGRYVLED